MAEIGKRLGLVCGAVVLALASAEGLLRLLAPIPYSMAVVYQPDGHIAERLARGQVYRLADGGRVSVNRLGFRGSESLAWEKPAGTIRVAVLGGSSTFSYNTDDAAIWTARLEQKLRDHCRCPVQVINAGQPGLSAFESRFNYLYRVRELDPDVVVVYHGWNDMKYFKRIEAGERPVWVDPFRPDPLRSFLRRFQLAWRLRALLTPATPGTPPPRPEGARSGDWFEGQRIEEDGPAHRWAARNYRDLVRLIAGEGALPVLLSQATLVSEEALADPARRERIYIEYQQLPYEEVLRETRIVRDIVRGVAEDLGAGFIDVQAAVPPTLENFLDHVHLTPEGNEAVAEAIFRGLLADPRSAERLER